MTTVAVPHLVLEDFLDPHEHDRLLDFVRNNSRFRPAQVTPPGSPKGAAQPEYRSASVTEADDEIFALVEPKLRAVLPHARRESEVPYFAAGGPIERQLTAHRDGDFFHVHSDLGDPWADSASRRLSFVYYFHDQPRAFEGGELRLYDFIDHGDGQLGIAETFQTVEPSDNSIVFFPSHCHHEVRPVRAGDPNAPGATRYTVNGWYHDPNHVRPDPPLEPATRTELAYRYTPSYTPNGFVKVKTPAAFHRSLRALYDQRISAAVPEVADPVFLTTGTPDFLYIDDVKAAYQLAFQPMHEEWCGQELVPTAAYGLRVYRAGHTLVPHTDTLGTHVISSIVHIAHDTAEPWPLWIKDLHGTEHLVVLEEGETLLYESAKCPHARPVPLDGAAYCSLFLHYRPLDWNVSVRSLIQQALADDARDVLPPEFWPDDPDETDETDQLAGAAAVSTESNGDTAGTGDTRDTTGTTGVGDDE